MRYLPLIIAGFLVACSGTAGGPQAGPVIDESPDEGVELTRPIDRGPTACGTGTIVVVRGPDGEEWVLAVPIACNPRYLDKGDPQPDAEARAAGNVVDPSGEKDVLDHGPAM